MDEAEIERVVQSFNTSNVAVRDAAWQRLRDTGEQFLPWFEQLFGIAKRSEVRRDIAFHSIKFARKNEHAFRIGVKALSDRSSIVRYRGCCILAYSLRSDALPML